MKPASKKTTERNSIPKTLVVGVAAKKASSNQKNQLKALAKKREPSNPKKRKRANKNPDVVLLGSLQKQFVISVPTSHPEIFSKGLHKFVPDNPEFWQALENAGSSREKYLCKLLDAGGLTKRAGGINRGARLLFSAAAWSNPAAGPKEKASLPRGKQWRTAMAWTGMELIWDSLFPRGFGSAAQVISEWCKLIGCETLETPIPVPGGFKNSSSVRGLWKEELEILDFIGIRDGKPRTILNNWWVNRNPLETFMDAMMVSKALRDVTLHGLMSANRVQRFGLSRVDAKTGSSILDRLVDVMTRVAVETLQLLLEREPDKIQARFARKRVAG